MTPPASRLPSPVLAVVLFALAFLFPFLPAAPAQGAEGERELEPAPPWIFFPNPDKLTAIEISELVENSFGDINKTALARDLLVERYGLWSVQKLHFVLKKEANESRTWNAALTAYALRDRLGNAPQFWSLLDPLVQLAGHSREPYRRAFAALALGSFHGPSFVPPPPKHVDPGVVRRPEREATRLIERGLHAIGQLVYDGNPHVEVAACLALGKAGSVGARTHLHAEERLAPSPTDHNSSSVETRMATLLAVGLLPQSNDDRIVIQCLRHEERRIRTAAALAAALQVLAAPPPVWVESPGLLLRALAGVKIKIHQVDGAEATFLRGVLASRAGVRDEWRALFALAVTPSTEEITKYAAAQCLLFCPEPWIQDRILSHVRRRLDPVVMAAFLLLLGESATPDAVDVLRDFLSKSGKTPKGKSAWDVRFFAVIGLLRALGTGKITDLDRRRAIFEALQAGALRGLVKSPFRATLRHVLDRESRGILESASYVVPERRVIDLERQFKDAHGLLARDLKDVAVVRLNALVPDMFNVNSLPPGDPGKRDKSEMPRRFLATCHARYPYFSRLDLRADRGRRPWPEMPKGDDPEREVRRR